MSLHNDPHIRADQDGFVARFAAIQALPKDERAKWDAEQEKIYAMRRRARTAYLKGQKAPRRRRRLGPHPAPSRQFATMATTAVRDVELSRLAVSVLIYLCALAGTTGYTDVTNRALGTVFNRSRSTIKRAVAELVDRGYVDHQLIHTPRGSVKCRRLTPTDLAWPYWHPKRQNPHGYCGSKDAPPITFPLKGESLERAEDVRMGAERRSRRRHPCGKRETAPG
jgi:hypothetical protein